MCLFKEPLKVFVHLFILGIFVFLSACSGSLAHLDKYDSVQSPAYTSDIEFGPEVKGTAYRSKLLGLFEWGDNDYFTLRDLDTGQWNIASHNRMTQRALSAAAYDALEGSPKSIIVDPQLRIKKTGFFPFTTYKATVYGRSAKKSNFRQVKRFNTDVTDTLPLAHVPQEYRLNRDGNETMRISATNNLRPHVAETVRIFNQDQEKPAKAPAKVPVKEVESFQPPPPSRWIQPPNITNTIRVFDRNREIEVTKSPLPPPLPQPPNVTNSIRVFEGDKEVEALQSPQPPAPLIQPEAAAQQFQHPVIQNVVERQRQRKFYLLKHSD